MQWFETWFNSPYYHLLYANRSEEEAENFIQKISRHLAMPKGALVLDVACGKGRHSKTLAKLGFDVNRIDLAKNSIACANSFACDHMHFEVWDMRNAYRANQFDFVFNLFSSFGYFDDAADDAKSIGAMYQDLKPGGTLMLDYINTEYAVKNMKMRDIIQRGEIQFHIQKRLENGFVKKKIEFLADGENYLFEEQLKIINRFKFEEMLSEAGFVLREVLGDYELNDFHPSSSPRLILIADKK